MPPPPPPSLSFHSIPHEFNSSMHMNNNTTPSQTIDPCLYGILGVHTAGIIYFIILLLPMGFLLVARWKTMVFNKRLLYIILILICVNQIVFQSFGVTYTAGLVSFSSGWIWTLIHAFESSGMMISITLCMNSQAIIAKIIYNIYFNKEQSWMRNNRKNEMLGKFYKISSISIVIILNVLLLVFVIAVCILFMIKYAETDITSSISDKAETVISVLGLFMSLGMLYFTILNVVSVVALVRKLLPSNPSYPTSKERKTACRKLTALSIGQLLTALLNIISNIVLMLKITLPPARILLASSVIHKLAIGILCLLVTFAFGPLDNISFELKKKEPVSETMNTVLTYKAPTKSSQLSATDSDDLQLANQAKQSTPISPYSLNSPSSIISNEELLISSSYHNTTINTLHSPETSSQI